MTGAEILRIRSDPKLWFQGFGRYRDEESRQPVRGKANILQRRVFEHYRRCQAEMKPCRMVVLKYRRAGSSTASSACIYTHAQNHTARLGAIGTDYRAATNMLDMVKFFAEQDDFPGWTTTVKEGEKSTVKWEDYFAGQDLASVPLSERVDRMIATRIEFSKDTTLELYTAGNPESARSAGLNGYHATEVGRWPSGGALDGSETLVSMRNTLPKKGFHVAIEESTANGAQGAFYDTCRRARWPDYDDYWKQWQSDWPLEEAEFGRDLQFVFIFAAWFEDERHVERLTPEQAKRIEETLDGEPWYEGEKELIARYQQEGPKGPRLGGEVNATVWEQLAWRRGIIQHVCTRRGRDEFQQEYPSNPREAFLASGAPVFEPSGLMVIEEGIRASKGPDTGIIELNPANQRVIWRRTNEGNSLIRVWEHPRETCRYLAVVDPIEWSEIVKGSGERDRNSVLILRDAFTEGGDWWPAKVVARVKPPNQWDPDPLAQIVSDLSTYYGRCTVVVESNKGGPIIERLRDKHHANLYVRRNWNLRMQQWTNQLGFTMDEASRRQCVAAGQEYVREQKIEILCPQMLAEMRTFIFDTKGKACAASGEHDDDVMALAIALVCLPFATTYTINRESRRVAPDEQRWRENG